MRRIDRKALLVALIVALLGVLAFAATWTLFRVPENCASINKVNDRLDQLVAFTSVDQPDVQVDDPKVQDIIDRNKARNVEFKALDAKLSKEARCRS